jgi:hypothetical protein
MKFFETPGALKRFRRIPWRFQRTFQTPVKNLLPFVSAIVSALQPIQVAQVIIDAVVFEPRKLIALLEESSIGATLTHDVTLEAAGEAEVQNLLRATLSGSVDFVFVPTPPRVAIYADHDEYTTFFSVTKSHLNRVVRSLTASGFQPIEGYERRL